VILQQQLRETASFQSFNTIDLAPTHVTNSMVGQLLCQHLGAGSPVHWASLEVASLDPQAVVVIDGSLSPDQPGLGTLISRLHHNLVGVVVAFCDEQVLIQAQWIEYGAQALVGSSASLDELGDTIRRVRSGETLLGVSVREGLLSQLRVARQTHGTQRSLFASLTKREAGVLRELANGKSPEDVARINYVSLNTVRTQIRGVLAKLSTGSVVGAVALAYQSGWMATGTCAKPAGLSGSNPGQTTHQGS
jgi:DNA-binding NarL/FixJ family response regulator